MVKWEDRVKVSLSDIFAECNEKKTNKIVETPKSILEYEIDKYVYFIITEHKDRVKIGISNDPKRRLEEVQKYIPYKLILLFYTEGNRVIEQRLHEIFEKDHVQHEWFKFSQEIQELINKLEQIDKQIDILRKEKIDCLINEI